MKTESMKFNTPNGETTAHIAHPDDASKAGSAVILIQEWWGLNDHIKDLAQRYAMEGYLCVAPDLYRGKITRDASEASRLMHELDIEDGLGTIRAAIDETRNRYHVNRIAITGYCMGGTYALRAACDFVSLSAAAPFYGDIPDDEKLSRLKVPVLFIAGARDNWITPEKVEGLKESARK